METVLKALPLIPEVPAVMITGPLMPPQDLAQLRQQAEGLTNLTLIDFVEDLVGIRIDGGYCLILQIICHLQRFYKIAMWRTPNAKLFAHVLS